jgi:hypothetical protein
LQAAAARGGGAGAAGAADEEPGSEDDDEDRKPAPRLRTLGPPLVLEAPLLPPPRACPRRTPCLRCACAQQPADAPRSLPATQRLAWCL